MVSSDDEIGLRVSNQLKQSSKSSEKHNIRQSGPLRSTPGKGKAAASAGTVSDKAWLQQCEELYESLPKNSAWAKHKLKVVSQAIKLLTIAAAERTAQQAAELNRLLGTLKLTSKTPAAPAPAAAGAPGPVVVQPAPPQPAAAANDPEDTAMQE